MSQLSSSGLPTRQILGVTFYAGQVGPLMDYIVTHKGLVLAPAGPNLYCIQTIPAYRESLLAADVVITDSSFMVLLWAALRLDVIPRISGLLYLKELLKRPEVRTPGKTLWVMASPKSGQLNLDWLNSQGIQVPGHLVYYAPFYGDMMEDLALVQMIEHYRPDHVILTVGGLTQERLGLYLKQTLSYLPGIHCIGAAIAFLSGDQVRIPMWADKLFLGWLCRIWSKPGVYLPRYLLGFKAVKLMIRYGSKLPPLLG